ncbi:MAG TPA: Spy/CpxP family protein refolding chaperone [Spirochaetota bacterium]|nr:Spy/CpxP family protein refolding chaperone [Spirochaetota bacterium]HPC42718.1 Spy/CpxP family protein refolding chaperone [Spirochaetota bacterium]HPL16383.1 Spy/CpxP family protein refolding chaperone [Spirochaetota bacterium]HQF08342.1 Spy/CpxP family protein refolding chaperone [Spirochaetota bacterium]HQH98979.1 Spy/CpxP family protein refolding chaperone [Spirochaetota bacterium]
MQKGRKIIMTAAIMALCAQPLLFAQGGGKKGEGPGKGEKKQMMMEHRGHFFGDPERMKKELKLTDEQVTKIEDINREHRKKMLDYKEKLAPKEIQLKKQLLEDTVDMARVRSLLKEIGDLKVELQALRIEHRLDIEKVLTPDQKAKMRQHRMHMMKKGMDRGYPMMREGHRGHGGPGPDMM